MISLLVNIRIFKLNLVEDQSVPTLTWKFINAQEKSPKTNEEEIATKKKEKERQKACNMPTQPALYPWQML